MTSNWKLFNVIHRDLRQHRFVFNNKSSDAIHDVHLGSGDIKRKNGAKRNIIFDDDTAACLFHVAAYQPESDTMIFAGAAGDAALEDPIAQRLVNAASRSAISMITSAITVDQAFDLF